MSNRGTFDRARVRCARPVRASSIACIALLLYACEEVAVNADRQTQTPEAEVTTAERSDNLVQRVLERWKLLVERDFSSAYDYEAPSYRTAFTKAQYQSRFGSDVAWKGAKVAGVKMNDDATQADVAVDVEFKVRLPGTDTILTDTRRMKEKWLVVDDRWWHVSEM